jgi:hypothetical protein
VIREKPIPDPGSGVKTAPDPESGTLPGETISIKNKYERGDHNAAQMGIFYLPTWRT